MSASSIAVREPSVHAAPAGFWSTCVLSTDHKTIGKQFRGAGWSSEGPYEYSRPDAAEDWVPQGAIAAVPVLFAVVLTVALVPDFVIVH